MTRISKFSTGSSADDQKKVLKALTKSKNLVVNCINVVPQKEAECTMLFSSSREKPILRVCKDKTRFCRMFKEEFPDRFSYERSST